MLCCFNAPCKFTPLLILLALIFNLIPLAGVFHFLQVLFFFLWEHHFHFRPFDLCPLFLGHNHSTKQGLGLFYSVTLTACAQNAACYMSYLAISDRKMRGWQVYAFERDCQL